MPNSFRSALVVPLLVAGTLLFATACNQGQQEAQTLQTRVDSLTTANQQLQRQVRVLRDTLRQGAENPPGKRGTTLSPAVFFPSGSAWLTDRGKEVLDDHAETIKQRYENRDFRIKGYTDSVPIGDSLQQIYPSNWYLSAQRSAAVAHYLDKEHQVRTRTLEIGAYGPQAPLASNETAQGRQKNRRVELVIDEPQPDPGF